MHAAAAAAAAAAAEFNPPLASHLSHAGGGGGLLLLVLLESDEAVWDTPKDEEHAVERAVRLFRSARVALDACCAAVSIPLLATLLEAPHRAWDAVVRS